MTVRQKSAVFEHFSLTSDRKYYVCQCTINKNNEETICHAKISAYSGSSPKGDAPTRASNLKRHLERCHSDIFKLVKDKDKAFSETSTLNYKTNPEKKLASSSLTSFLLVIK